MQSFSETTFVAITRAGTYQGLCLWFECDFDGRDYNEDGQEFGCVVKLSTSPSSPPTHWKQTVVVLGYGTDSSNENLDLSCQEDDPDEGCSTRASNVGGRDHQEASGSGKNPHTSGDKEGSSKDRENQGNQYDNIMINKDFEVDEDEVVGWRLVFAQSKENIRHYTMTVEMLDPETEEHPIPCGCPMPRCVIIAKMMEREEMGDDDDDDAIDCT